MHPSSERLTKLLERALAAGDVPRQLVLQIYRRHELVVESAPPRELVDKIEREGSTRLAAHFQRFPRVPYEEVARRLARKYARRYLEGIDLADEIECYPEECYELACLSYLVYQFGINMKVSNGIQPSQREIEILIRIRSMKDINRRYVELKRYFEEIMDDLGPMILLNLKGISFFDVGNVWTAKRIWMLIWLLLRLLRQVRPDDRRLMSTVIDIARVRMLLRELSDTR